MDSSELTFRVKCSECGTKTFEDEDAAIEYVEEHGRYIGHDPEIQPRGNLAQYDVGDTIIVSARETPMEITDTNPSPDFEGRVYEVIADNHHGKYQLTESRNGRVKLSVSHPSFWSRKWSTDTTDVEVERA